MRALTAEEESAVRWFAEQAGGAQRLSLLGDLADASVEEIRDKQLTIRFEIEGYKRPPYRFERPIPIDATAQDADGASLAVVLSTDANGRLFELQVMRFEHGPVLRPDWSTLRLLQPDEIVRLNEAP
jgi:hypothetical protein